MPLGGYRGVFKPYRTEVTTRPKRAYGHLAAGALVSEKNCTVAINRLQTVCYLRSLFLDCGLKEEKPPKLNFLGTPLPVYHFACYCCFGCRKL